MPYTAKKTVEQIVASKNNYCIGLKGNQPTLLRQAQHSAQTQEPLSQYYEKDLAKGRQVERQVELFSAPPEAMTQWSGLAVSRFAVGEAGMENPLTLNLGLF